MTRLGLSETCFIFGHSSYTPTVVVYSMTAMGNKRRIERSLNKELNARVNASRSVTRNREPLRSLHSLETTLPS